MRRHRQRGNMAMETLLFIPLLLLLIVGMVQIGKITYIYYTLKKTLYAAAMYLNSRQAVNFCDAGDTTIEAAKNYALTGNTTGATDPFLPNLTPDRIQIEIERFDPATETMGQCDCSAAGCDISQGGQPPDFIVVTIPDGYEVTPRIPFMLLDPIPLKPEVRVPYRGT